MNPLSLTFANVRELDRCINTYFTYLEGVYHYEQVPVKTAKAAVETTTTEQKVWDRPPEPPTLSGLAYHLGFISRKAFEACETKGRYAALLQRARLRIEAEYERKLHYQSPAGAIFALRNMGWQEKANAASDPIPHLKIKISESGPAPASAESEVELGEKPNTC